jgi:ComF family protein
MTKLIFQFKGCFDIDLSIVFLERHLWELKLKYFDYIIIPVPSTKDSDEVRGFNHVVEIFKHLKLKVYSLVEKTENFKQSDLSKEEREKVKSKFKINNGNSVKGKKILIVDDIVTTGSSIKAVYELISEFHPKKIECLTVCKKCR